MIDAALTPIPILNTPKVRRLLRQRCPHNELVKAAFNGWFRFVNTQAMKRGMTSYLVYGVKGSFAGATYCLVITYNPQTGAPIEAGICYLWSGE